MNRFNIEVTAKKIHTGFVQTDIYKEAVKLIERPWHQKLSERDSQLILELAKKPPAATLKLKKIITIEMDEHVLSGQEPLEKIKVSPKTHGEPDCEVENLNRYLIKENQGSHQSCIARVYVATPSDVESHKPVLGCYTVRSGTWEFSVNPTDYNRKYLKNYPIKIFRIDRLVRDFILTKKAFGNQLLGDALTRIEMLSRDTDGSFVQVETRTEHEKNFYYDAGFIELKNDLSSLIIPIETIRNIINNMQHISD